MHTHPKPWHRASTFAAGFRHPLDRERREQWKARVELWRRSRNRDLRLTGDHTYVALALLRRLGQDGRLDPSHQTLADASGVCVNTVKEALRRMAACGLLTWARRIVREGSRVRQTSNSYMLTLGEPPAIPMVRCKATTRPEPPSESFIPMASHKDAVDARDALARRRAAVAGAMLNKGI